MSQEEILAAIPHRPPMLLLDRIVERSGESIVCTKQFHEDEYFFQGHYPGSPIVPGVILCEAAMQAGAVLLSPFFSAQQGVPVATRIDKVKFKQIVRPGDEITIEVNLVEQLASAFFLQAKVLLAGKVACRFEFACTAAEMKPR